MLLLFYTYVYIDFIFFFLCLGRFIRIVTGKLPTVRRSLYYPCRRYCAKNTKNLKQLEFFKHCFLYQRTNICTKYISEDSWQPEVDSRQLTINFIYYSSSFPMNHRFGRRLTIIYDLIEH